MDDKSFSLSKRRALVTGATGGIGSAVVRKLHGQGATVAMSGTRQDRLKELEGELGERAIGLPCDLTDRQEVANLVPRATKALGSLDILVNNAGVTRDALLLRMPDSGWDDVLAVNLTAAMILCRSALRPMMRARWGRIVSITSVVGVAGNPGQANYAASKAGLTGFSKSLAQEVASRGITVNCVAPGLIETAMIDNLTDAQKSRIISTIPVSRLGAPNEVAQAVLYLATDEAGYVTGQTLHVNGGMEMI
ncbi:MAG: 3-oxoacyl-[acyl-carrier-protein] reductase [Rhodobacteraceae bacterium]|nr:3-oxoacyl-[acyl-carrier-protein] reductase [Paracoccaceae bacterium]